MATKTISVDLEAYDLLNRARASRKESFSQVIKRAVWRQPARTCGDVLKALPEMPVASEDVLTRLEQAQKEDGTPDDPWS